MNIMFLESLRVYLRPLQLNDLTDNYLQWLNDEEVCRYNSHATFPYTAEKMNAYFLSLNQNPTLVVVLAIIEKDSNKHIGNISLQAINWIGRSAEFAILLGDKNYWGKGFASEAAHLICEYGFQRLNLHRIYCGTSADNNGMKKLAGVLKMQQEGIRRHAIFKNGNYVDISEVGVLADEFFATESK